MNNIFKNSSNPIQSLNLFLHFTHMCQMCNIFIILKITKKYTIQQKKKTHLHKNQFRSNPTHTNKKGLPFSLEVQLANQQFFFEQKLILSKPWSSLHLFHPLMLWVDYEVIRGLKMKVRRRRSRDRRRLTVHRTFHQCVWRLFYQPNLIRLSLTFLNFV